MLSGCCSSSTRAAVDTSLLLAIGAAFGLGAALDVSGAAGALAQFILGFVGSDPWWSLLAIYMATVLLTETVTNNAAAIIMWPIALGVANAMQVTPLPYALAIMIAASASFLSPYGYHTNLMVAGPGGYRPTDYLKFGLPVAITVALVTLALLPLIFPLHPV